MSWQLAAFSVLALGLAAGFAWYERTRPDARILALVATLAAFAALGRIAFAALPNVKPTTDIVLISGYALGGAPGFVVGAVAGLTSNFFFGQGPWTPWQMAAWGVTGVLGAGLAVVTARRIGRWSLAVVCAVLGYAFAAVQDVGDWVTYSDHSLAQLGVYVGKGTGFDAIHAGGCLMFALAFGPAMTRSIQRYARRLHTVWRPSGELAAVAVAIAAGGALLGAGASPQSALAGATPAGYLRAALNHDGGVGMAPGSPSSSMVAGWAALGLAAVGENPAAVSAGGPSLLDYVEANGGGSDAGSVERTILAVQAAGFSARNVAGHDLVAALEHDVQGNGSVAGQVNLTAFAVLALRAAGVTPAARTLSWLARQQDSDGGFSFSGAGGGSDVDDTGAALQALGRGGGAPRAVTFLRAQQNGDGGFPQQAGGDSNAQSTAWAVQGLLAAGVAPASLHRGGSSPLHYLRSLIAGDGHVRYARDSDQTPVWVTADALLALAGKPLPLAPLQRPAPAPRRRAARVSHKTVGLSTMRKPRSRPLPLRAKTKPMHRNQAARSESIALQRYAAAAGVIAAVMLAPVGAS